MKIIGSIVSICFFLFSCSTKPEDACNCIKEAANKYVQEGVEIENIDDVRVPCKDLIDKFQEDPSARAMIIATGTEVYANLENKQFTEIVGEDLPEFPSFTFNTIQEFYDATRKPGGKYKYWRTNIEIKKAYLINAREDEYDNKLLYVFDAIYPRKNNSNEDIGIRIPRNKLDINKISKDLCFNELDQVFDTKDKLFLNQVDELAENDIHYKISNIMSFLIDNPSGDDDWGSNSEVSDLTEILESKKINNFLNELKNGRYLFIDDEMSKKLSEIYGEKYSLTEVSIKGVVGYDDHEWNYIDATSIENIKKLEIPSELKRKGNKIDPSGLVRLKEESEEHLENLYDEQVYSEDY